MSTAKEVKEAFEKMFKRIDRALDKVFEYLNIIPRDIKDVRAFRLENMVKDVSKEIVCLKTETAKLYEECDKYKKATCSFRYLSENRSCSLMNTLFAENDRLRNALDVIAKGDAGDFDQCKWFAHREADMGRPTWGQGKYSAVALRYIGPSDAPIQDRLHPVKDTE